MGNRWKSRYGNCFVSFPSVAEEAKLEYEIINFVEE
jgi:hypothetical protein